MLQISTRRLGATFLFTLMSINTLQVSWAKASSAGETQITRDVQSLDGYSLEFNSKAKSKERVDVLIQSYENFLGRSLEASESNFLKLELASIDKMPRFEIEDKHIKIFDVTSGSKDLLLSIEVVDAEKSIFKFGGKTFQLKSDKALQENVQEILKHIQAKGDVSWMNFLNPLPQAHAEFPSWLKTLLIVGVALVAGIFIGKAIQKNKAKKESDIARRSESRNDQNRMYIEKKSSEEVTAHETVRVVPNSSTDTKALIESPAAVSAPEILSNPPVTTGLEPDIV